MWKARTCINKNYTALTLPASMHLVRITMFGSRFSQIIRQKSEVVFGMGPVGRVFVSR